MTITLLQVEQAVKHWVTFVKGHEKILSIALAAFLIFHFGEKGLAAFGRYEAHKASIEQQKVNADATATKSQDTVVANLQAQLIVVQQTAATALAEARKKNAGSKATDDAAPLPDLANTWASKINVKPNQVIATKDIPAGTDITNTITVDADAAHKTVDKLEDLDLEIAINNTLNQEYAACSALSAQQTIDVNDWKKQFTDEHNARIADAKVAKTAERKAYLKGFKHGVIVTVAVVVGIKIATL